MTYLVDTNVISELRKQDRADPNVTAWYETVANDDLYLSVLVLGEIRQGIERARLHDPDKASALDRWVKLVTKAFGPRILPITLPVAEGLPDYINWIIDEMGKV